MLVFLFAAALGCSSCDYFPSDLAPIGLSRNEADEITLRFYVCPNEFVQRVSVLYSPDFVVGNEDDDVYWMIKSEGATTTEFTVGETPAGFIEVTPLTRQLPAALSLSVDIETTDLSEIIEDFEVRELPQRGVDVKGDVVTESEHKARALERCD